MTREKYPQVSVVIPSFNHAAYLAQRLMSIFNQRFRDFEIIFLDDASTDNSVEIAKNMMTEHPMRMVINSKNSGTPFSQWNKGVSLSRGKYVWLAESDDVAHPDFLGRLVDVLSRQPHAGLVYCQSHRIDDTGRIGLLAEERLQSLHPRRWKSDFFANGKEECRVYLARQNTIANASAVVFRRSVYEEAHGADESFQMLGDWDLWSRMLLRSDVAFVADPLNQHRLHEGSVRRKIMAAQALIEEGLVLSRIHQSVRIPHPILRETTGNLRGKCVFLLKKKLVKWKDICAVAVATRKLDSFFMPRLILEWYRQTFKTSPKEINHT